MAYSDFDLATARNRFGLTLVEGIDLFVDTPPVEPGDIVKKFMAEWAPLALAVNTEKARSEWIISPILLDVLNHAKGRLSIFSGVAFDVDRERGLNGACDFLLCRSPTQFIITDPVVTVIEAKREDINAGLGQCAASMVGAQVFNARSGRLGETAVFGAVTTGTIWRFLRLHGSELTIDRPEYYSSDVGKILAILLVAALGPEPASSRLSA